MFVHICYQGIQDVLRLPSAPRGNTVEMSSLIYANKHCEMTSFTPPPIAGLPGDPVALKELLGSLEGNFLKSPAWVISGRGRASSVCLPALQESKCLPESGAGSGGELQAEPTLLLSLHLGPICHKHHYSQTSQPLSTWECLS